MRSVLLAGLRALVLGVPADDRALDTVAQVRLEHLGFDLGQGRPGGVDLGQDVDAITPLFYHPADAAHLSFHLFEARQQLGLVVSLHGALRLTRG